jgi:hypothetical protein
METISHELCQKDLAALEKAIKDEELDGYYNLLFFSPSFFTRYSINLQLLNLQCAKVPAINSLNFLQQPWEKFVLFLKLINLFGTLHGPLQKSS